MYILSCCIKLGYFNHYPRLFQTSYAKKFCHNKPVKVSVDGQMNTFSDQ